MRATREEGDGRRNMVAAAASASKSSHFYGRRVWRKYRFYFLIAVLIFGLQVFIAFGVYRLHGEQQQYPTQPNLHPHRVRPRPPLLLFPLLSSSPPDDVPPQQQQQQQLLHRPGVGLPFDEVRRGISQKSGVYLSGERHPIGLDFDDEEEAEEEGEEEEENEIDSKKSSSLLNNRKKNKIRGGIASSSSTPTPFTSSLPKKSKGGGKDAAEEQASLAPLPFPLDCDLHPKEAISAINRAKTLACKKHIANVSCLLLLLDDSNQAPPPLFPHRLQRTCPTRGRPMGEYVGCFSDDKVDRLLSGRVIKLTTDNSPEKCIDLCLQSGFPLAGVQYGVECFCGDDLPPSDVREAESTCDVPCSGDESQKCGGFYKMNVYHTGIHKSQKASFVVDEGVANDEGSEGNKGDPVRVLYLLSLNGRALRQIRRLLKAIYHANSYFYVHVDSRQDYVYRELLPLEERFPNFRLARRRLPTIWGGASLLRMMLQCMEDLFAQFDHWKWDFLINLSESDFPIKTHEELVKFLSTNRGKNFLKSHGRDTQRFIVKQGLDKVFVECEERMWRVGSRALPRGLRIDGGSDWVGLSRDFCFYLTAPRGEKAADPLLQGLKDYYSYALLPAESFFHTALRNGPFCDTFVDNNLHVTNWKRKVGCRCQYKHVVDWCGCSPNVFRTDDWARIRAADAKPFFFARKFEPIVDQAIVDQLETWLFGPPKRRGGRKKNEQGVEDPAAASYWQNEYHHADATPPNKDEAAALVAYNSFARLAVVLLVEHRKKALQCGSTNASSSSSLDFSSGGGKVLEATLYNRNDVYEGTLVLFEWNSLVIETLVRPRKMYRVVHRGSKVGGGGGGGASRRSGRGAFGGRLQSLLVGTLYDQKEQFFRNVGGILGPLSEPCLMHRWGPPSEGDTDEEEEPAAPSKVTFVWVDPTEAVAGSFEVQVELGGGGGGGSVVLVHRPTFEGPLRPGPWTVLCLREWEAVAQVEFLVLPSDAEDRQRAKFLNGGPPSGKYMEHDFRNVERVLGLKRSVLPAEGGGGEEGVKGVRGRIDGLVTRFYSVQDTCLVEGAAADPCWASVLDMCQEQSWSSRFPDPKSELGPVDPESERMVR